MTRLALFGAGLIGRRHAQLIHGSPECELVALVEPSMQLAGHVDAPHFASMDEFLQADLAVDGAIIATPNDTHRAIALSLIERGCPLLIEKPLAASSHDARAIAQAADAAGVPVLVGHHRRHHEATQTTRRLVADRDLGQIVAAQVTWALRKPEQYFADASWRQGAGGGPVWINLIHEIDMLRCLLGEIEAVSAMTANGVRGAPVEDCAVVLLRFSSGALATVTLSDATPTPWHFEGASGENPNIARTRKDGLRIMGTKAALSFPSLKMWRHENEDGDWSQPIEMHAGEPSAMDGEVALLNQLRHFVDCVRGRAEPLVSAQDGLANIEVTEAILKSAEDGRTVLLDRTGNEDESS